MPLYARHFGVSEAVTGLLSASYSAMQLDLRAHLGPALRPLRPPPHAARLHRHDRGRLPRLRAGAQLRVAAGLPPLRRGGHRQPGHRPRLRGRRHAARGARRRHGHHRHLLRPRLHPRARHGRPALVQVLAGRSRLRRRRAGRRQPGGGLVHPARAGEPHPGQPSPPLRRPLRGAEAARDPRAAAGRLPLHPGLLGAGEHLRLPGRRRLRHPRARRLLRLRLHRRAGGAGAGRAGAAAGAPVRRAEAADRRAGAAGGHLRGAPLRRHRSPACCWCWRPCRWAPA